MDPLSIILVPISVGTLVLYHCIYFYQAYQKPDTTVFGVTRSARHRWVRDIIRRKNGILAVQTLRNWIMMSSLLGSTSMALTVGAIAFLATMSKETNTFIIGDYNLFLIKVGKKRE
jgi:uncharacterized membrane protein